MFIDVPRPEHIRPTHELTRRHARMRNKDGRVEQMLVILPALLNDSPRDDIDRILPRQIPQHLDPVPFVVREVQVLRDNPCRHELYKISSRTNNFVERDTYRSGSTRGRQ